MAYQNINFPTLKLIHDFRTEAILPTTIVSNFAKVYRINRYASGRSRYTFPARNLTAADWTTLYNFINAVGFKRDSFNFVIPAFFTLGASSNVTVKARFDSIPESTAIAFNANGTPKMYSISEFSLITVLNE